MAGGSVRRDPSLPGVAGLSKGDYEAWRRGEVGLEDLAAKVGVSGPAVSKAFRKWKRADAAAATTTTTSPASTTPAAPPADPGPADPAATPPPSASLPALPAFNSGDALILLKSAAIATLVRSHATLVSPGALGASALKALSTAIMTASETLVRTGVLRLDDIESDRPRDLIVRVLTEDEEREIRRRAESPDPDDDDDLASGDDGSIAPPVPSPPAAGG